MPNLSANPSRHNYYHILNLTSLDTNLTIDEINKSFRKLALANHPDKNNNGPPIDMALLILARDTLIDPQKRALHDAELKNDLEQVVSINLQLKDASKEFDKPFDNTCSPLFYCLKRNFLLRAISHCHDMVQKAPYNAPCVIYSMAFLRLVELSFIHKSTECYTYMDIVVDSILLPIQMHIKALGINNDDISNEKIRQLTAATNEIEKAMLTAMFKSGVDEYNHKDIKDINTDFRYHPDYACYHSDYSAISAMHQNVYRIIKNYANNVVINAHRNLVKDIFRNILGVCVMLGTLLPTAGIVLLSKSYRNCIRSTFFSTKSRSHLDKADMLLHQRGYTWH